MPSFPFDVRSLQEAGRVTTAIKKADAVAPENRSFDHVGLLRQPAAGMIPFGTEEGTAMIVLQTSGPVEPDRLR